VLNGKQLNRPGIWAQGGSEYIVLTDYIHNWLVEKGLTDYHVHNSTTSEIDFHHDNEGLDVWFDDPNLAMMFKLAFGGPKA
jgi:hypothetical protein